MIKRFYCMLLVVILGISFIACGTEVKNVEEIPISLSNWEEYFELNSTTEVVIDEDKGIKQAEISYEISLKEEFVERVVMEKENEIQFKFSYTTGSREITFLDGRKEIELGDFIYVSPEIVDEKSIHKMVIGNEEYIYETGKMLFFGTETRDSKARLTTIEKFNMLEINGFIYFYEE